LVFFPSEAVYAKILGGQFLQWDSAQLGRPKPNKGAVPPVCFQKVAVGLIRLADLIQVGRTGQQIGLDGRG
jgi:hypothetical protein